MTRRAKPQTAAELLEELQQDPDSVRRAEARERSRTLDAARVQELERRPLERLAAAGCDASSIVKAVREHAPFSREAIAVLRRSLVEADDVELQDSIVRALGASGEAFPGPELTTLYDATTSEPLRWAIANMLAVSTVVVSNEWLIERAIDAHGGRPRQMLVLALARITPSSVARSTLRKLLVEMPGHVAISLAEVGDSSDSARLRKALPSATGWVESEIKKAISKIDRRA